MKVLLLGFAKIAYMPYMQFYLDSINPTSDIEFDLIYWDRDGKPDEGVPSRIKKVYKFEEYLEEQLAFRKKLCYFINYRRFVLNVLQEENYDKIIVLHTTPGLTILDYLIKHYKGRYILDFRDISYEYYSFYRNLVSKMSKNAECTFVSSDAFRKFLSCNEDVYTIHNYLEDSLNYIGIRDSNPRKRDVIRISFWGLVRQLSVNKSLIDSLGNDERFELHYYGRMQQEGRDMEAYSQRNGYNNVFFHGAYLPSERYVFSEVTDIIHNVYDLGYTSGNAMGNKFYDGIIFEIPQICTKGSYMGGNVSSYDIGITIDLNDPQIGDKLWNYYNSIDWNSFRDSCKTVRDKVICEQATAKQNLNRCFH